MKCFENIVGISRTQNACFTEEFSETASKSNSGLYLDELEGFPSLDIFKSMAAHDQTTMELILRQSLNDGANQFITELYKNLGTMYTVKHPAYVGNVGNSSYSSTIDIGFAYAGMVLDMAQFIGAEVKLTGIKPFFNLNSTLVVKLYRAYNSGYQYQIIEELASYTLNTSASSPALQEFTQLSLATTDEDGKSYSYIFLYDVPENMKPRDNKNSCGCGHKEDVLFKYLRPYGVQGVDKDNLMISNRTDKVNGLQIYVQAMCTGGDFVCQEYYSNPLVKKAIEWQILRKSAAVAITKIITTSLVDHYTMARREQLSHTINILNSQFKNNVMWIAENINVWNNECFICNIGGTGSQELTRGGILL